MRLFTTHQATCPRPAAAARYYSLGLPASASPPAGGPPGARAARERSRARQTLRQIRHQPTGIQR
jgi:hypothetical protein